MQWSLFRPPDCNKSLRDVNLRECFSLFQHDLRGKVQCNEIDAFYYYWLPFGHATVFPLLFTLIFMLANKFLIALPLLYLKYV